MSKLFSNLGFVDAQVLCILVNQCLFKHLRVLKVYTFQTEAYNFVFHRLECALRYYTSCPTILEFHTYFDLALTGSCSSLDLGRSLLYIIDQPPASKEAKSPNFLFPCYEMGEQGSKSLNRKISTINYRSDIPSLKKQSRTYFSASIQH